MKRMLLLSTMLYTSSTFAQITLESTDYLQAGDTARLSQTTDNSIDFISTGVNSVWDFSNLQAETQSLLDPLLVQDASFLIQMRFGNFAPAKYISDYYNSYAGIPFDQFGNFLPVNIEDIFRFTKIDSDSVSFTGYSMLVEGNDVPFQSDTTEVVMRFPMNFGDSYSGRAYSKVDFNPIFNGIFIQYRQRETVVDGYGSLLTPYGNFNTIRLKHTVNEQDSLYADLLGFATWIPLNLPTQHIYEWWAKGELVPVMKIETQLINGDEVVTSIEYKDEYRGLTAQLASETFNISVYPNPSDQILSIETNTNIKSFQVYSSEGKLILSTSVDEQNSIQLSTHSIPDGNYLLLVDTTSGKSVQKIVIKH